MSEAKKVSSFKTEKSEVVRKKITAEFPPKFNFELKGDTLQIKAWKKEISIIDGREANFLICTLINGDKVSVPLGANLKKIIENLDETLGYEAELSDGIKAGELFISITYLKDIPSKFKANPTKIFECEILEY